MSDVISRPAMSGAPFDPMKGTRKRRTTKPAKPPEEGGNPLLDSKGAASYLGISDDVLDSYRKGGLLKPVPLPSANLVGTLRKILFRRSDLDDFVSRAIAGNL